MKKIKLMCPICGKKFKAALEDNPSMAFGKFQKRCPNEKCKQPLLSSEYAVPIISEQILSMVSVLLWVPRKMVSTALWAVTLPFKSIPLMFGGISGLFVKRDPVEEETVTTYQPPRQRPCLRPLRQPLWDTEFISTDCHCRVQYFINQRHFLDGSNKSRNDTNMECDGDLRMPVEADLTYLQVTILTPMTNQEFMTIAHNINVRWFFGGSIICLDTPLSLGKREFIDNLTPEDIDNELISQTLLETSRTFLFDMRDHLGHPRHILSSEPFRGEIENYFENDQDGMISPHRKVKVRMAMRGLLYVPT